MAYQLTPGKLPVVVNDDVHFWLTIGGVVQRYCISHEALEDHFGEEGRADDRLEAFKRGREAICGVAATKYGAGVPPSNGNVIVIKTCDFPG